MCMWGGMGVGGGLNLALSFCYMTRIMDMWNIKQTFSLTESRVSNYWSEVVTVLSLFGSLPLPSAYSFASNWQLSFLNQRKNGRGNYVMTNLHEIIFPNVRIEPATVRIPSGYASDRAPAPGAVSFKSCLSLCSPVSLSYLALRSPRLGKRELVLCASRAFVCLFGTR